MQGGQINAVAVDPMTFLMHSLSERYSKLGEETRLEAITVIMNFRQEGDASFRHDAPDLRMNQRAQVLPLRAQADAHLDEDK